MKIGILGSGIVAQTLAAGFLRHGNNVTVGSREPAKLAEWKRSNPQALLGSFSDAATFGDVVVLAVKGTAAIDALRLAGSANLAGKPVIDSCNPIAEAPPDHGVLKFFTTFDRSLMEQAQRQFPDARFVKAFNSVGSARMVNPQYADGVRPTMFICGNDSAAKKIVSEILDKFGWETADMGSVEAARAIEPLCMLWCIPGFTRNEWSHAFQLLRQ